MDNLQLIGRHRSILEEDLINNIRLIKSAVEGNRFLVLGGAGSIGQAVVKQLFSLNPALLHVVDISENNLVELVRDIRSSMGYISGEFQVFALDVDSPEFEYFFRKNCQYDYVLNLSALKHVRSEKDPYTLMRMLNVNILNVEKTLKLCSDAGVKNYFVVSTDKAANPVNLMGASKRVMEMFLMNYSEHLSITAARFANVAFSDGSLLYGFEQRLSKRQPLSAPRDVKRYFVTATEAGQICLFSALLGKNRDIFYPKLSANLHQTTFSEIAKRYLKQRGFKPIVCSSESEARDQIIELEKNKEWPCYFFDSDTTGEKDFEEFTTIDEVVDVDKFLDLGIIKQSPSVDWGKTQNFVKSLSELRSRGDWTTSDIIQLMTTVVQNFNHKDAGKFLDEKM